MRKEITYNLTLAFLLFLSPVLLAGNLSEKNESRTPVYTFLIVNKIPHDFQAYTQGLVFDNGYLYEGTGKRGHSSLRRVDPENGAILTMHQLADEFFGEGITIFDNKIYQLTWQAYTGFVYDKDTFLFMEEFFYNTEGWGITHNNQQLIISDGTNNLYFLDPSTFEVLKQIQVSDENGPVNNLNELEFIDGEVYANILGSYKIARINAPTINRNSLLSLNILITREEYEAPNCVPNRINDIRIAIMAASLCTRALNIYRAFSTLKSV